MLLRRSESIQTTYYEIRRTCGIGTDFGSTLEFGFRPFKWALQILIGGEAFPIAKHRKHSTQNVAFPWGGSDPVYHGVSRQRLSFPREGSFKCFIRLSLGSQVLFSEKTYIYFFSSGRGRLFSLLGVPPLQTTLSRGGATCAHSATSVL